MNSLDVHLHASNCGRPLTLISTSLLLLPILLVLMPLPIGASSDNKICNPMVDIVIAVDTSSSCTDAEFQRLLSKVNDIASKFEIDQFKNQLALIGMSDSSQLVATFGDVRSQADFSSAVGKLKRTTDKSVDMTLGLKLARESAFTSDRGRSVLKLLILVKDRQCSSIGAGDAHGADYFVSIGREAAALRQMACAIHAVGVGGLWNTEEIKALFGTEYLLFYDQSKAMEYAASINQKVCRAECDSFGDASINGTCFNFARLVLTVGVQTEANRTNCTQSLVRSLEHCPVQESCAKSERIVGPCQSDGKAAVERKMQMFNRKTQTCENIRYKERVQCDVAKQCPSQVADVVFVVTQMQSRRSSFDHLVEAVLDVIKSLYIGPNNVRIAVLTYNGSRSHWVHSFGDLAFTKEELVRNLRRLLSKPQLGQIYYGEALTSVKPYFDSSSRPGVKRALIYFSDQKIQEIRDFFYAVAELKSIGVTIYAVGIQPAYGFYPTAELTMLTAPETATNMYLFDNVADLKPWAVKFSMRLCDELSPANPRFCNAAVQLKSIIPCSPQVSDMQITWVQYEFDSSGVCVKHINSTVVKRCNAVCTDPIDGKHYHDGESWTSFCHELRCDGGRTVRQDRTTKCLAADSSCKPIGSPPFYCRNSEGSLMDNCRCVSDNDGRAALVIEY